MRLLDVKTKQLKDFHNATDVPYAILSHCWEDDEVLYQDIVNDTARDRKGYEKISNFCDVAARDGFQYAWIDTCCIDKSSSAELSEAINSMFNWYQQADVCFAYLSDCPYDDVAGLTDSRQKAGKLEVLRASKWFTRGWTLQELIAPRTVIFLSSKWREFGTKSNLRGHIREITNIHEDALVDPSRVTNYCVAERLSWAASRTTTRPEDQAYSLMGLLNVNMPLLYGEGGEDAFTRLQLEILRKFNDQSIFAWRREKEDPAHAATNTSGVLADSVRDFKWCHSISTRPKGVFRDIDMGEATNLSQEVVGPFVKITGLSVKFDERQHDFLLSQNAQKTGPSSVAVAQQPQTSHEPNPQSRPIPHIPDWLSHVYGQFKEPSVTNHWLRDLCIMLLEECFSSEDGVIGILLHREQNAYTRAHYPSIVILPNINDLKGDTAIQSRTFHVLSYPPRAATGGGSLVKTIHLLTQPALYQLSEWEPRRCSWRNWVNDTWVYCGDMPHWCDRRGNERLSSLSDDSPPLSLQDWILPDLLKTIPMFLLYSPARGMAPAFPSVLLWFSIDDELSLKVQFNVGDDAYVRGLISTDTGSGEGGGMQSSTDSHGDIGNEVAEYVSLKEGVRRCHLFDGVWMAVKMREGMNDIYLHIELDEDPV